MTAPENPELDRNELVELLRTLVDRPLDERQRDRLVEAVRGGSIAAAPAGTEAAGEQSVAIGQNLLRSAVAPGGVAITVNTDSVAGAALQELVQATLPRSRRQLPTTLADFEGRREEIALVHDALSADNDAPGIVTIGGMGGVGKTSLATLVSHRLGLNYPDGQIWLNLHGVHERRLEPFDALVRVIHAFHPTASPPASLDEAEGQYRSLLSQHRCLVVLDDAQDEDHVASLLPPPSSAVILTSRRTLVLPGATSVALDVMKPAEAVDLMAGILSSHGRELAGDTLEELARRCAHLPLALRTAASFLAKYPNWSARDYLARLDSQKTRLLALKIPGHDSLDVRAVLWFSVVQLERNFPGWAESWALLSLYSASFDLEAASAMLGLDELDTRTRLGEFVARAMLGYDERSERYQLHDLMRDLGIVWLEENPSIDDGLDLPGA